MYLATRRRVAQVTTEFLRAENESPSRLLWRNDKTMRSLPRHWDYTRKAAGDSCTDARHPGGPVISRHRLMAPVAGPSFVPNARLIMLSGAGHLTYVERNDRLLPALMRFIAGDWPPEAMQLRTVR